jgi:L-ascorbate metabolism protein UlaG (beta-lactamase superfamily)
MKKTISFFIFFTQLLLCTTECIEIQWYGHSAFKITAPDGRIILLDPWITNPRNPKKGSSLDGLTRADYILISHGHGDAIGDSLQILQRTNAQVICSYGLGHQLKQILQFPKSRVLPNNLVDAGGSIALGSTVTIHAVEAHHGSELIDAKGNMYYAGTPLSYILEFPGGPSIFYSGDTTLNLDWKLLSHLHKIDILIICIGGHFTMGPKKAAFATSILKPKLAIPMRYQTFPLLCPSAEQYVKELNQLNFYGDTKVLKINEVFAY